MIQEKKNNCGKLYPPFLVQLMFKLNKTSCIGNLKSIQKYMSPVS